MEKGIFFRPISMEKGTFFSKLHGKLILKVGGHPGIVKNRRKTQFEIREIEPLFTTFENLTMCY